MGRNKEFDEDELLEKAVNLFWQKGYNATSAQDLVDALGINRSSLYNTYTDKKTLFTKSLKHYQLKQTNAMIAMLAKADNPKKALKQVFSGLIQESTEDTLLKGCLMVNTAVELSGTDPVIGDIVNKNNKSVEDALTKLIEKGQHEGQFSKKAEARALARFIFGNITAIKVAARMGTPKKALEDIAEVALAALK
ncbi:TetR/AcrR family transcriptional regulator [Mucilaginibacter sp. L3T2-6]|uniref:TetR/AcrR family transcriptional regulator n=1 Tax=Mucilaginibacter sp. L3T2-6 TaxID=3062491 RepID=UPI002674FD77|nr:TetR/AcrR family transcriptional regulator [Mucilaginibacter sp. L3T2-6]MDO3642083.1 TetR/AcrR family transcriptional regulator [Mucilaginibacter sp. L3T2-6]MDV6214577.1 TetR/AcrR family transcriptional regulator [Mucilaginibacter sp. L3T2-6]